MTLYVLVKYLHVLGAVVILGTGTGIAFFMLMAHRSGDARFIARTASTVVIADMLFTLTAVQRPVGLLLDNRWRFRTHDWCEAGWNRDDQMAR